MYRRTFAEINLDNLEHNVRVFQKLLPEAPLLCPMVKANAYGHGDVQVAKCLELLGVDTVGVCLIEEGVLLRTFGYKKDILVFRGFDLQGARKIVEEGMTPIVSSWKQLQFLEEVAEKPLTVHLKFDTGMNRLGFSPAEADQLLQKCWQNKKIRVKAVLTHLLEGEDAQSTEGRSAVQLRALSSIQKQFQSLGVYSHSLNSAGCLNKMSFLQKPSPDPEHPLMMQNWGLRPGLAIYGYDPVHKNNPFDFRPVMSLKSQVSVLRFLKPGETVSYGGTFKAQRETVIGVVPIGYADGYHRILSNLASAIFMGQRVPVVGNVCMDYLMLDITDVVQGKNHEDFYEKEVILFGADNLGNIMSASELAQKAQSITWEMLTSVGERVPRILSGQKSKMVLENLR